MTGFRLLRLLVSAVLAAPLGLALVSSSAGAAVPAPSDLRLVSATASSVELAWTRPDEAIPLFRVAWTPTEADPGERRRVRWTSRTEVALTGLLPGTSYDVRVRAVDGTQPLGPFTEPLTVRTTGQPGEPGVPPPPPTTPPPPSGDTLFGANYTTDQSVNEGVYAGRAEVARIFFQQLDGARFSGNRAVQEALDDGVRTFVISWKETDLAAVRSFLAAIPAGLTVYTSFNHEPENDEGRPGSDAYRSWATEYRQQWVRQAPVMRAEGFVPTSILMAYTLVPSSGRTLAEWMPPAGTVDVMAFDAYYGKGKLPSALVARMSAAARQAGLPTGLAETGAPSGDPARLANTVAMRVALLAAGNVEWGIYWNGAGESYDARMDRALADAWFGR